MQPSDGRLALAELVVAIALLMAACAGCAPASSAIPSITPTSSPAAVASAGTSAVPAPRPTLAPESSPSGISVLKDSGSGVFGAGTYATAFQPPMTFTLPELTIAGARGTIAYESIGEDDANEPGWIAISFGFDKANPHGSGTWSADVFVTRIDKVFDPKHPATLIEPPKDLAAWIGKLPGLTVTAEPKAVKIDGRDAVRLDVVGQNKGVLIGPIPGVTDPTAFGVGPHQSARIVVVTVDGHDVLIVIGADDSVEHFDRAVAALQPLVDSIAWH